MRVLLFCGRLSSFGYGDVPSSSYNKNLPPHYRTEVSPRAHKSLPAQHFNLNRRLREGHERRKDDRLHPSRPFDNNNEEKVHRVFIEVEAWSHTLVGMVIKNKLFLSP